MTVLQVCALTALTVRKHKPESKNPIGAADLNGFLLVTMKVLNSCWKFKARHERVRILIK